MDRHRFFGDLDERLNLLRPLTREDEEDFEEIEQRIVQLRDEIALAKEAEPCLECQHVRRLRSLAAVQYCASCPRKQERLNHASLVAKKELLITGQYVGKRRWIQEIEAEKEQGIYWIDAPVPLIELSGPPTASTAEIDINITVGPYTIGQRIAFDNGEGGKPRWFFGSISEVRSAKLPTYRIVWDDGFVDSEQTAYYQARSLRLAEDVAE